ncbi:MAG: polyketide synthase, partial [Anaerolineales bacterium]
MDPQLRLLLECTFEAMNDAGLSPADLKGSNTGVFVGGCFSDMHDYTLRNADEVLGYENTGCAHSMFANRLSFAFDWHGPSFTVDTACSSSLVALVSACKALKDGDCDYAIVGGASITLRPEANLAFDRLHMLSPDGACKSFDTAANGYARSEAIGVVILSRSKTTQHIKCRNPYAYILGYGCNNDGFTAQGITFPNVDAQIALNTQVCRASGVDPSEISYIEAHGTGTIAGDGVELKALDTVYGLAHTPENPLLLGSVKSNMGHSEGAA